MGLSLPVRVGIGFAFILSLALGVWIYLTGLEQIGLGLAGSNPLKLYHEQVDDLYDWTLLGLLILLTSIVAGYATYWWLLRPPGLYPEIDAAWQEGVADLAANGIRLEDCPIFVVLGIPDTPTANALMDASKLKVEVRPRGATLQPLIWFAALDEHGEMGIFLFLCTCCQTSLLVSGRGERGSGAGGGAGRAVHTFADNFRDYAARTIQSFQDVQRPRRRAADEVATDVGGESESSLNLNKGRQSVRADQTIGAGQSLGTLGTQMAAADAVGDLRVRRLSKDRAETATIHLWYVCQLLKGARQPDCPLNGVVAAAPYNLLRDGGESQAKELAHVTRSDLRQLTLDSGLRTHVVALVTGLEADDDFPIFIRRTAEMQELRGKSPQSYLDTRFGKGLPSWVESPVERVEQLAQCACAAFESQIYQCFRATLALKKADNGQLYRFLARIRNKLSPSLQEWLVSAFATRANREDADPGDLPRFAGCYLVATSAGSVDSRDDERLSAFVPGVFDKLFDTTGDIEWTDDSLDRDQRHRRFAGFFFFLTMIGWAIILAVVIRFVGQNHFGPK